MGETREQRESVVPLDERIAWLSGIVSTWESRPQLHHPWTVDIEGGPWTVATNGWRMVALRGDFGCPAPTNEAPNFAGSPRLDTAPLLWKGGANGASMRLRIWRRKASGFDPRLPHRSYGYNDLEGSAARDFSAPQTPHVALSVVVALRSRVPCAQGAPK